MDVLLQGVVGSTAYGLATPESDVDRLGIFACRTEQFFTLRDPKWTIVTTHPDSQLHEAKKYCQLALQCNPTVLELLWLDVYDRSHMLGRELLDLRHLFLSAKRVRDAYFGYATQQLMRLHSTNAFNDKLANKEDQRKKVAKHARHTLRLLHQGLHLYRTGHLQVRLEFPDNLRAMGEQVADGDVDFIKTRVADYERWFDQVSTALPSEPDQHRIEMWLHAVRREFLAPAP